ncbi:MAG: hypothetical protein M3016_04180 [Actinomycetota bacterium]|nr:hypothetical protein [Actinomycetota bacterium]
MRRVQGLRRIRARRVAVAAVLVLGLFPAGAQAFSKAIWGPAYRHGRNQFPLYRKLGVRIYEVSLNWATVAPQRPRNGKNPRDPAYRWPATVRQEINLAHRYHMQVLMQLIFAPRWANHGHAANVPPTTPAIYGNFAKAAAREYRGVHLWMVWGEPDRTANFSLTRTVASGRRLNAAQKRAPHLYARLIDCAYGSLKAVSKRNLVIGGSTFSTGNTVTQQWIENLRLPSGRPPRMDMYAHNPFSAKAPNFSDPASPFGVVQFSDLPELARWIDRYLHRGMRIFLSEFTIPTKPDGEFNFYVDPEVAGRWTAGALRLSRRWKRIYALGWIHVYDAPPLSYGGLLTAQGKPKPSFYAFEYG